VFNPVTPRDLKDVLITAPAIRVKHLNDGRVLLQSKDKQRPIKLVPITWKNKYLPAYSASTRGKSSNTAISASTNNQPVIEVDEKGDSILLRRPQSSCYFIASTTVKRYETKEEERIIMTEVPPMSSVQRKPNPEEMFNNTIAIAEHSRPVQNHKGNESIYEVYGVTAMRDYGSAYRCHGDQGRTTYSECYQLRNYHRFFQGYHMGALQSYERLIDSLKMNYHKPPMTYSHQPVPLWRYDVKERIHYHQVVINAEREKIEGMFEDYYELHATLKYGIFGDRHIMKLPHCEFRAHFDVSPGEDESPRRLSGPYSVSGH